MRVGRFFPTRPLVLACVFLSFGMRPLIADFKTGLSAYLNKDYSRAAAEFMPLAIIGDARAQYYIGVMSFYGQGVAQDRKAGIQWLSSAADRGHAHAAAMLGLFYSFGPNTPWYTEVPTDLALAVRWLRVAVRGDDLVGERQLAFLFKEGDGVPQDFKEAASLYRLAAEQGDASSQCSLGYLYFGGEGVIKDYVQADLWFNIRAGSGKMDELSASCTPAQARDIRDSLEQLMTPNEIAEAQRLAREWKPRNGRAQN